MDASLYEMLKELHTSGRYPFHMPGHKRGADGSLLSPFFSYDITEIHGFDDLHNASGVIRDIEKRAADVYGADEAFLSVNGSTAGILAAISSISGGKDGSPVLIGRNAHSSAINALYLNRLTPVWMYPGLTPFGSGGVISPSQVHDSPDKPYRGVFITSPTYDGVVSDVSGIADAAHARSCPLITDCAHGAHFGLHADLPKSPVTLGSDITVVSLHKTLPSLTQTALVLVKGDLVDRDRLKFFLRAYQTSSPSYPLMASAGECLRLVSEDNGAYLSKLLSYKKRILKETASFSYLRVPGEDVIRDPSKIVVICENGYELFETLRTRFLIDAEMASLHHVVFILTSGDTDEGVSRLIRALSALDEPSRRFDGESLSHAAALYPEDTACPLWEAVDGGSKTVPLEEAAGKVSADTVSPYPPGIPLLVPGEVFTEGIVRHLLSLLKKGATVNGCSFNKDNIPFVRVSCLF